MIIVIVIIKWSRQQSKCLLDRSCQWNGILVIRQHIIIIIITTLRSDDHKVTLCHHSNGTEPSQPDTGYQKYMNVDDRCHATMLSGISILLSPFFVLPVDCIRERIERRFSFTKQEMCIDGAVRT